MGAAYSRKRESIGGSVGGSTVNTVDGSISGATGNTSDGLFDFGIGENATSGIGILRRTGSAVLKVNLDAMESLNLSRTISNPKIFTLDNQEASIKQGEQIPVAGGDGGDTFADANLKLTVTPNIIGDGNVMLTIAVNNDEPIDKGLNTPGINTMEINTKLLVADGDIVVIGGIKKNKLTDNKASVPGANKLPVIGKLMSGTFKDDSLSELLVFIAPRIL